MVKRSGAISNCCGCKEGLNKVVMGKTEKFFFPKVDSYMNQIKYDFPLMVNGKFDRVISFLLSLKLYLVKLQCA